MRSDRSHFVEFGKAMICVPHHWYLFTFSMEDCFEFGKGWFSYHTLLEGMAITGMSVQTNTDNAPAYNSKTIK